MHRPRRLVACLSALPVVLGLGWAYQTQNQPIFRGGADVIRVDISVLDRQRAPVRGLTADDFKVLEDGKAQRVVGVSEVVSPDVPEPPPVWSRSVQPDVETNDFDERRLFVIVLDDALCCPSLMVGGQLANRAGASGVNPRNASAVAQQDPWVTEAVKRIGRSVVSRLVPGDLASVVYTLNTRKSQSFTSDRDRLLASVDAFADSPVPHGPDSCQGYRASIRTLWDLTDYLIAVPQRRKTVLYVSPGIPVNFLSAMRQCPMLDLANDAKEVLWRAQRANVNIYGIDPVGLIPESYFGTRDGLKLEFLRAMSDNTGGRAFIDSNDFDPGVAKMFDENASYYLLGYQTTNPNPDGKFRRLVVSLNRPGEFTIRVRSGYYRPRASASDPASSAAPSARVPASLANLMPNLDMTLRATAAPFVVPGRPTAAVAAVVGVRQPVSPGLARLTEDLNLRVIAYTADGDPRYSTDRTTHLTLMPGPDDMARAELFSRLDLPPGRYRLRYVVHDAERSQTGSLEEDVVVPDFAREAVSLSGAVLTAGRTPMAETTDLLAPLLPVMPTAEREFAAGDAVTAFVRVYEGGQAPVGPVTLSVRIVDRFGAEDFHTVETIDASRFDASRAADFRFTLPLARLKPGSHLLTLEAAVDGRRSPTRDVVFDVR